MTASFLIVLGVPAVILAGVWWHHERTHQSGWIDVAWTAAVGLAGALAALWPIADAGPRQMLYAAMVAIWALRLGAYLFARTRGHPDDPRYAKLRHEWGARAPLMMAGLLVIQAVVASILAGSVALVAQAPVDGLTIADGFAATLFAVAVISEGVADAQMRRFKADPANKGRVCDAGLWAWSRHPNYFFEWLTWVAVAVGAFAAPAYLPGWLALAAPLLMLHLLLNVSGVPPLEEHMRATRGPEFDCYAARVSPFFPRPPRKFVEATS